MNLFASGKLLVDMGFIELLLNMGLEAEGLLYFGGEFTDPRGLGPGWKLKITVAGSSKNILRVVRGEARLSMLLLPELLDLMHDEVVRRSERLSRPTNCPHRV